jgi:23S rRNA (uracil1939-C5)-methyltransferase
MSSQAEQTPRELILTLQTMLYGGETMGRLPDGRAVFVPFALPGEKVRVQIVDEKRGYARARLLEVLEASPQRISARCKHFQECGGCHYQHLGYGGQLQAKEEILVDQLKRIAKMDDVPMRGAVASPNTPDTPSAFAYRNHVQFHLDEAGRLGYVGMAADRIMAIEECHLPEEPLNQVWRLLSFDPRTGIERVSLRLGAGDEVQMILESSHLEPPEISIEDLPLSVVHLCEIASGDYDSLVLAGSESLVMEVLARPFRLSAGSFFQVNSLMAEALVTGLMEGIARYAHLDSHSLALDVYCGVGLFSAFLAPKVGRLVGIESSTSAVGDFVVNLDEFDHVEIYEAPAAGVLPSLEITNPQLVVVDPPRAGLERGALDALLRIQPGLLAYVSCDPSTLARDARRLAEGGYRMREVALYDLFPQTYHIESLSFWTK